MKWLHALLGSARAGLGAVGALIGPKVFLVTVALMGAGMAFLWWRYDAAVADAAASHERAVVAREAAAANVEAARAARRNAEVIAETLGRRQQREQQLRARLAQTHDQLEEARHAASQKVRDCLAVRLPADYLDGLRAAGGGDADGNAEADPAPGPD